MSFTDTKKNNTINEYRKVQGLVGESSFSIVLPKSFANALGIGKGDFVKVYTSDEKIVVEKAK
jgi:AbrB family looped-hinge helix DNA binding protein